MTLGDRIRALRRQRAWSQDDLAEKARIQPLTLRNIETGRRKPRPTTIRKIAEALKVTPEELQSLAFEDHNKPDRAHTPASRPYFGALIQGAMRPRQGNFERDRNFEHEASGRDVHAATLHSFRLADQKVGGAHLYATVVRYLQNTISLDFFAETCGNRKAVYTAAAAMTEMAGWMAHEAGQDETAHRYFLLAYDLARLGEETQLATHVLASMAHLALHQSRPREAIHFVRQGHNMLTEDGARQTELEARLLALEARGMAALGHGSECVRLLGQAEVALSAPAKEPLSHWVSRFDEGSLANEMARSMCDMGDWKTAGEWARRIIALRPPDRVRSRAFGQLIQANALFGEGMIEEACAVVQEVITSTLHLSSHPVMQHLVRFRERFERFRSSSTVSATLSSLDATISERRWLANLAPDRGM